MSRLRAGLADPLWVVSRHQSEGRGRRGTGWQSPPGNLAATLALRLDAEPAAVATLGFVAGLATARALARCCGTGTRFGLKWPNDILADGAKMVGILLETETLGPVRGVAVGIGINVAHRPEGTPYGTASLASLGCAATAEEVFLALSAEWPALAALWNGGLGFAAIRKLWLDQAVGLGGPITVRSQGFAISGTFETLDGQGQLVIRTSDGSARTVSAGDVHFGAAATVRTEAA